MQEVLHQLIKLRELNENVKSDILEEIHQLNNYEINLMLICEDDQGMNYDLRLLALKVLQRKSRSNEVQQTNQDQIRIINQFIHLLPKVIDNKLLLKEYHKIIQRFNDQPSYANYLNQQITHQVTFNIHLGSELLKGYSQILQYYFSETRDPLEKIVAQTFPIFETYLNENNGRCDKVIANILNILRYSNGLQICKYFYDLNKLKQWILYCMGFLKAKQDNFIIDDNGSLGKNVFDRCQKFASYFIQRLNIKYRNIKLLVCKEEKQIGKMFNDQFAIPFMEIFLTLVIDQQHQQSNAVVGVALKYLQICMRFENTAKLLSKRFDQLIYQIIIPYLQVTDQDVEKWNNDPQQFILQQEEIYSSKGKFSQFQAIELVTQLIQYKINKKDKNTNLIRFLNDVLECFNTNFEPYTKTPLTNYAKEAYLQILQELANSIRTLKKNQIIEELINNHIIPELFSEDPFLRARVCQVVQIVSLEQHAVKFIPGILKCIYDKELPVQVGAVNGLSYLLKFQKVQTIIAPHIKDFLDAFFKLIDQIEVENLIVAFSTVIDTYPHQVKHYHLKIIDQISYQICKFKARQAAGDPNCYDDDPQQEESELVLESLCQLLSKIILLDLDNYQIIEDKSIPIIDFALTNEGFIIFEGTIFLINQLLHNQIAVSDQMWKYFTILCYGVVEIPEIDANINQEFALQLKQIQGTFTEYIDPIIRTFRNFIKKGGENLFIKSDCFGTKYIDLLIQFAKKCMTLNMGEESRDQGFLIFICIVENCFPIFGQYFGLILNISLETALKENANKLMRSYAIYTICVCYLTMPKLIFELNQVLDSFMEIFFKYTQYPKQKLEYIIPIQFLSQLLIQEPIPQEIQNMYQRIFQYLINCIMKYKKLNKNKQNLNINNYQEGGKKEEDEEVNEIEKVIKKTNLNEVIEREKDNLGKNDSDLCEDSDDRSEKQYENNQNDDDDDDDDDEDDSFFDYNEKFEYHSRIETQDLSIYLKQFLQEFKAKKLDIYEDMCKRLTIEGFQIIQNCLENPNPMEIEQQ